MGRLRGLESWIRDTRQDARDLERDAVAEAAALRHLEEAAHRGSGEELDHLARGVAEELVVLARKLELLKSASARISPTLREQLDEAVEKLAGPRPEAREETGVRRIARSSLADVLDAEVPVLVNLALEGHPACQEAQEALESVREVYGGDVKLCSLDVLEVDQDELLPHMVKIGRNFMVDNLPAVLLFWRGRKIGGISGDVDTEAVVELLRSEVGA